MTIADYCQAFSRGEIIIDRKYQRSPSIWPSQARSYLIETILKGFPIPKLALHQVTDLQSRKTIKYVVDGQQRTMAIVDFFRDKLALSPKLDLIDAQGAIYTKLDRDLQSDFLSYALDFDQFEAASDEDVREYFRRINYFTAPLNAEEHRHAKHQGDMKWFIVSLIQLYGEILVNLDILPERSVVRMADAKFMAEIIHALIHGITTTSKSSLDRLYADFDKPSSIPQEPQIRDALMDAFDFILRMEQIRDTALMKMNVFYSLLLAVISVQTKWPTLPTVAAAPLDPLIAEQNLLTLASALDAPDEHPKHKKFTAAAAERTNVKDQRTERVRWLAQALSEPII